MNTIPTTNNTSQNGAQRTAARPSLLSAVRTGRIEKPLRVLLYGVEGIGKSTFAANSPAPIFLCSEDGTSELDVARFPQPRNWQECFDAIRELTDAPHDYKTLVIDTLDWLEPLAWNSVIAAAKKSSIKTIEDFGFGKGYLAAVDEWRRLTEALDALRTRRNMHIILLSHAKQAKQKNPEGDDWDRYSLKIDKLAAGHLKEWSDAVLFATHEVYTRAVTTDRDGKTTRAKAFGSGARWMHTEWDPAWDAKNRFGLPAKLPIDWHEFYGHARATDAQLGQQLHTALEALLAQASPEVQAKCRAYLGPSPSTEQLTSAVNRLRATVQRTNAQPDADTTTDNTTGESK